MRVLAWFSCGAASAVAAKMAIEKHGDAVDVLYCDTMADEHPDQQRFFDDAQEWLGVPIIRLKTEGYDSVDDVFEKHRFMSSPYGAKCTVVMKKMPRFAYQTVDDVHVFGLTADEPGRIARFEQANHDMKLEWPLQDHNYTKAKCLARLVQEKIELPAMYSLGFRNNNCLGCVKSTSGFYWNAIRRNFPATFQKRCEQSRELGVRLVRYKNERIFLDELPADYMAGGLENISCGPDCAPQMKLELPQ
tara:strand:- start:2772 stop:3512 length:741 start_codon:yes stop_codon:yes gene_type:complete